MVLLGGCYGAAMDLLWCCEVVAMVLLVVARWLLWCLSRCCYDVAWCCYFVARCLLWCW